MKKLIKEIINFVLKYSKLWGSLKVLNAIGIAVIVPVNTIIFQKILDEILFLLSYKQLTMKMCVEF